MKVPDTAEAFLRQHGWGDAIVVPVAGDASFRRYFRVSDQQRHAILMDAPPPEEDPRPFIAIARYLRSQGFEAPEIFAENLTAGLVLLQDFGDRRMREHLDHFPDDELPIYARSIDLLSDLHGKPAAPLAPYDWAQYQRELLLLTEWYCVAQNLAVDGGGYLTAWREALAPIIAVQSAPVTVLRDYHAENIMLLDNDALGLLDFQDALQGHRAYDLVSLLQDARRQVPDALEAAMIEQYLRANPDLNPEQFRAHYAILGAQRNAKIIGIFTRLWKRDGKLRYLDFLPRMWGMLEKDLAHPALAAVSAWFDENIPMAIRQRPIPGAVAK
ncbi:MAG: phosphotransferase [Parasphingorhabdus sp.]|nr:phosphotransferase [Parasphingorhabdus sp.]